MPTPGVLRIFLPALSHLPLLLFVLLSAPAWVCWPFMPERKQRVMLEVLQKLIDWTRVCAKGR
ncbi:membrane protein [Streptomyces noursei ATCC 11455]|nr:membrane protein [Streptomyces noursei ATCC 11455]